MHGWLLCAGLFWWQQGRGDTVYSAQNSNGLLFFEVCSLAHNCALQGARTYLSSRSRMRDHSAGGECMGPSVLSTSAMQMLFLAFRAMFVALFTFPR